MRNSLIFKLMGAFLLVIAIGASMISVLTSQATQSAFNLYTTRNGQVWAQRLAPQLVDYYSKSGSWQGVEAFLQSGFSTVVSPGMMMGEGGGPGQGRGQGAGRLPAGLGMGGMGGMEQRVILVNEKGVVIVDSQAELMGKQIPESELKFGEPVRVNNALVGTLIVTPNDIVGAVNPATEFLASVNRAIISSAVIASFIALIIGAVLFFQIIAPLQQLKRAATAISGGNLNQRVEVRSRDELGDVGQAFNQMAESLEAAETQRKHLIADVAHELRTPLAAIQGTLEGMQDGVLPLDEEQITALHAETMLLNRLINDLRLLSLAEAGQLKLEQTETLPGEIIQQVVERIRPQADLKKISLVSNIQPNLPETWIDADRITQVLNNLISNALRYTPQDGTITVQVAQAEDASRSLQVSVTDTGVGIDPSALPFVFDRFYRSDKSRTRSSGGSGLGLAIVKQLIEAHGGKVTAESPVFEGSEAPGYGTRISFTLPTQLSSVSWVEQTGLS